MPNKKDRLTIPIVRFGKGYKKKKKHERHPPGGWYMDHPEKKYEKPKPPKMYA